MGEKQRLRQSRSSAGLCIHSSARMGVPRVEHHGETPGCHHPAWETGRHHVLQPTAPLAALQRHQQMEQQNKYESCEQFMAGTAKRRGALGAPCSSQVLLLGRGLLATDAAAIGMFTHPHLDFTQPSRVALGRGVHGPGCSCPLSRAAESRQPAPSLLPRLFPAGTSR